MDFKRNTQPRTRHVHLAVMMTLGLVAGLLVAGGSLVAEAARIPVSGVQDNPNFGAACGTDVVVVLDESGSIATASAVANVETAVRALVSGLKNTGSRMRFSEFSTNARDVQLGTGTTAQKTAFKEVDETFAAQVDTYLTTGGNAEEPSNYNPGVGQQFTNWEAGLFEAASPASPKLPTIPNVTKAGAPLVVFITDGNPNTVGTSGNSTGNNQSNADLARDAAINEMAALQAAGSHVLSIAVGAAFDANQGINTAAFQRLANLTESNTNFRQVWTGTGNLDIRTTDLIGVQNFGALEGALRNVVFALCAPSVSITKLDDAGNPVIDDPTTQAVNDGWPFALTVKSMTDGTSPQTALEWTSPDDGAATTPSTKTVRTNSSGIALFQWTPNSKDDPKAWDSTVTFNETLPPGWTADSDELDQCLQRRAAQRWRQRDDPHRRQFDQDLACGHSPTGRHHRVRVRSRWKSLPDPEGRHRHL